MPDENVIQQNVEQPVQATEQPVQATEQPVQAPEYALGEDGKITGSFMDQYLPDTQSEQPVSETSVEPVVAEQPQMFEIKRGDEVIQVTQEQLVELAHKGHDYTQKAMALAEQKREFEQRMNQQVPQEAVAPDPREQISSFVKEVEAEVAKLLGEEYQPYDPIHQATFNQIHYNFMSQQAQQNSVTQNFEKGIQAFATAEGASFQQIIQHGEKMLAEMPYAEGSRIMESIKSKDTGEVLKFLSAVKADMSGNKQSQAPVAKAPVTIPSSPAPQVKPAAQGGKSLNDIFRTITDPEERRKAIGLHLASQGR